MGGQGSPQFIALDKLMPPIIGSCIVNVVAPLKKGETDLPAGCINGPFCSSVQRVLQTVCRQFPFHMRIVIHKKKQKTVYTALQLHCCVFIRGLCAVFPFVA